VPARGQSIFVIRSSEWSPLKARGRRGLKAGQDRCTAKMFLPGQTYRALTLGSWGGLAQPLGGPQALLGTGTR
jgi:hypothetical protein